MEVAVGVKLRGGAAVPVREHPGVPPFVLVESPEGFPERFQAGIRNEGGKDAVPDSNLEKGDLLVEVEPLEPVVPQALRRRERRVGLGVVQGGQVFRQAGGGPVDSGLRARKGGGMKGA